MNIHTNEWPPARVELLKSMCEAKEPYSAIAAALGVSRSAAIGKASRMGIKTCEPRAPRPPRILKSPAERARERFMRQASWAAKRADREAKAKGRAREIAECAFVFDQAWRAPNPVGLMGLTENTCRWPYGDPKTDEFHFCGGKPTVGRTYCPTHSRIAYRPATERKAA